MAMTNPWIGVDNLKAAAWEKLSVADQTWLGSADPTDEFIISRAPDSGGAALDPTTTIKDTSSTNPSATDAATAAKYADIGQTNQSILNAIGAPTTDQTNSSDSGIVEPTSPDSYYESSKPSSMPKSTPPAIPKWKQQGDRRVRLLVPKGYLTGKAAGPSLTGSGPGVLVNNGGIVFPYTPTINQEYQATYNPIAAPHTNFTQYFFKNSSPGKIGLSSKFTVQNETEAGIFLAVVHLLRSLVKMQTGNDSNPGSPPPVCRLVAHGDYMLNNVPVVIESFRLELPESGVDYFDTGNIPWVAELYGKNFIPVINTINLSLLPIYSRNEMLTYSVQGWLANRGTEGYL